MKSQNPMPIMEAEDYFRQRSFNLRGSELTKLKSIASKLGCRFNGESSVGRMLRMISRGELKVTK